LNAPGEKALLGGTSATTGAPLYLTLPIPTFLRSVVFVIIGLVQYAKEFGTSNDYLKMVAEEIVKP